MAPPRRLAAPVLVAAVLLAAGCSGWSDDGPQGPALGVNVVRSSALVDVAPFAGRSPEVRASSERTLDVTSRDLAAPEEELLSFLTATADLPVGWSKVRCDRSSASVDGFERIGERDVPVSVGFTRPGRRLRLEITSPGRSDPDVVTPTPFFGVLGCPPGLRIALEGFARAVGIQTTPP